MTWFFNPYMSKLYAFSKCILGHIYILCRNNHLYCNKDVMCVLSELFDMVLYFQNISCPRSDKHQLTSPSIWCSWACVEHACEENWIKSWPTKPGQKQFILKSCSLPDIHWNNTRAVIYSWWWWWCSLLAFSTWWTTCMEKELFRWLSPCHDKLGIWSFDDLYIVISSNHLNPQQIVY